MSGIGIVGAGISGLQLALRLQQFGVPVVIYTADDPDGLRSGRPRNFPARFGPTQQREEQLGIRDWRFADAQVHGWSVTVHTGGPELRFDADLTPPSSVVDFRLYLPQLLTAYTDRGGGVVIGAPLIDDIAARHDLVVVADGGLAVRELFPRDDDRSVFRSPQRFLCSGLYHGIREDRPHSLDLDMVPGVGEIFRIPFYSRQGRTDVLAVEAVPGGPLEAVTHTDAVAEPARFHREMLALVAEFAPGLRERIDTAEFELIAPGEIAQGGVTPVVRRGWAQLADGTCALAVGDAWITNDPLTAQGANLGSWTAFELAELVVTATGPYDAVFCRAASARLWEHARHVVEWSTAFLAPPPLHVVELLGRAAQDKRVADGFVNNFNDPVAMWRVLSSPAGVETFLAGALEGAR